eukprot:GHVS01073717.1.p1 GENE.GHVS01073717.1~~GHVS01073717.1.p1  ORF type:complete len:306 (+),score=62.55 GHVS01073717.1:818-1735(+)
MLKKLLGHQAVFDVCKATAKNDEALEDVCESLNEAFLAVNAEDRLIGWAKTMNDAPAAEDDESEEVEEDGEVGEVGNWKNHMKIFIDPMVQYIDNKDSLVDEELLDKVKVGAGEFVKKIGEEAEAIAASDPSEEPATPVPAMGGLKLSDSKVDSLEKLQDNLVTDMEEKFKTFEETNKDEELGGMFSSMQAMMGSSSQTPEEMAETFAQSLTMVAKLLKTAGVPGEKVQQMLLNMEGLMGELAMAWMKGMAKEAVKGALSKLKKGVKGIASGGVAVAKCIGSACKTAFNEYKKDVKHNVHFAFTP